MAAALALVVSGVALADDTSTNRFGGDGYAYFNQPMRAGGTATAAAWRQAHPNGVSNRELQAASSSSLAASAQLDSPLSSSAPADPSWRQTHPNGLTNRELQAAGASSLATWQLPETTAVGGSQTNVARAPSKARR